MNKKIILMVTVLVILLIFSGCTKLDVVGRIAVSSFEEVVNTIPEPVTFDKENESWALLAPDKSVRFLWSRDFSANIAYDVQLEIEAKPFLEAGLDLSKLPEGMIQKDKIIVGRNLGKDSFVYEGEVSPVVTFKKMVNQYPNVIGYHSAMDHFGVNLGSGNLFEWAKDMRKNDKDIVFVLDPEVFINAGTKVEQIEGWVYTIVETMDKNGKMVEVPKLVKPFDLTNNK